MSIHTLLDPNRSAQVPAKRCALGIMTKAPVAGKVKTRLTPPLTPEEAAALNSCFLRDVSQAIWNATKQAPACGVGIYTPRNAEAAYKNILPKEFFLLPQRDGEFGQRLVSAAEDLFKVGFETVCLINSDSPTVSPSSFAEAAIELANPGDRIVLGPSEDGGYYLIGLKKLHRRLFQDIDWSTERVLEQTKAAASEIGVPVHELRPDFDVDDHFTLARLCDELFGKNARSATDVAMETRKFLADIMDREGRDRIWPRAR